MGVDLRAVSQFSVFAIAGIVGAFLLRRSGDSGGSAASRLRLIGAALCATSAFGCIGMAILLFALSTAH